MPWDDQKSNFTNRPEVGDLEKLPADEWNAHVTDQKTHSGRHESGGIDEITVTGLSGDLADPQDPKQEVVDDFVDTLVAGGDKVTTTYDDVNGTLTIDTSALDTEEVEDAIDATLVGGTQVTTTYDDTAGTLTIDIDAPTQAEFDNHSARHEDTGADELNVAGLSGVLADAQTPQTEAVEDIVSALLAGGTNITVTYDDANDVLTVDTSALNEEEVEDAVAALVTAGNAITVNYDDVNDALSIGVNESALSFYDGTNLTANVDNQSVSTDSLTNNLESANNTFESIVTYPSTNSTDLEDRSQITTGVSTTATPIATISSNDDQGHMLVMVAGTDGTNRFWEVVGYARVAGSYPVLFTSEAGSPAARSYSAVGTDLLLTMAAGTYDVRTRTIESGPL